MCFSRSFVKSVLVDVVFHGGEFSKGISFSINSRTLNAGDVFVALPGVNTDGHKFVLESLQKGACGAIISREKEKEVLSSLSGVLSEKVCIAVVDDVLESFLKLAAAWRKKFDYPVVGITGSVGKTSTKEILGFMLASAGKKCLVSKGNQNTVLGVALNIFRMRSDLDAAVFEVGTSKRGRIAKIADVLRPTMASITFIGHCHMQGIGKLADIASEKLSIFKHFGDRNIGFINGDQKLLSSISYSHPVVRFGRKSVNHIRASKIKVSGTHTNFILKIYKKNYRASVATSHVETIYNGVAAAAIAVVLGVRDSDVFKAFADLPKIRSRFKLRPIKEGGGYLIDDSYNANPESMKAALAAFEKMEIKVRGKRVAVLGDMLELGEDSLFWHRQLGRFLRNTSSIDYVIFVGKNFESAKSAIPWSLEHDIVPDWKEAAAKLRDFVDDSPFILVKGSNSIGLSNLVDSIAG